MPNRRLQERRVHDAVNEPLDRKGERRQEDRRHSGRRAARFVVQTGPVRREVEGEVAMGGASFADLISTAAKAAVVELDIDGETLRLDGVMKSPTHLEFVPGQNTQRLAAWLAEGEPTDAMRFSERAQVGVQSGALNL